MAVIMEKRDDEATDGDGIFTMKTHDEENKNKINGAVLHVKGHMAVRHGMACIPLGNSPVKLR